MGAPISLDAIASLPPDPGATFAVRGLLTTSVDGSSFDALGQWDGLSPGAWWQGGLLDVEAGGLVIVQRHPEQHEYVFARSGAEGPGCAAAGVASPCFVPRIAALAHERLRLRSELAATLSGNIEVVGPMGSSFSGAVGHGIVGKPAIVVAVVVVAVSAGGAFILMKRRAKGLLGRVRTAARHALRVLGRDPSLAALRAPIRAMIARATELDAARRACVRKVAKLDRNALERQRDGYARAPEHRDVLAWINAECAEAALLEGDLAAAIAGLERIENALRVIALRARHHRGTLVRADRDDPVDDAAAELAWRDEARADLERLERAIDRQLPMP
jgi:hypothetical protein